MIKFPKVHIAASVVNRILSVADGLEAERGALREAPAAPNPAALEVKGAALDMALLSPQPAMPGIEAAPEVATGKPLLNTLIEGQQ